MAEASRRNDTKEAFRLSPLLSERALGPKRRDLSLAQQEKPTTEDRDIHDSKPDYEGGWKATMEADTPESDLSLQRQWPKRIYPDSDPQDTLSLLPHQVLSRGYNS